MPGPRFWTAVFFLVFALPHPPPSQAAPRKHGFCILKAPEAALDFTTPKQHQNWHPRNSTCCVLVVLDEFDAMARARGGRGSGDQGDAGVARDSVVNQLLAKMDGVEPLVVPTLVIGMTNKRSLIEPALLRPGRFEVQIEVPKPKTVSQRVSILNVHMKNMFQAGRVLVRDAPDGTAASRRLSVRSIISISYIFLLLFLFTCLDFFTESISC